MTVIYVEVKYMADMADRAGKAGNADLADKADIIHMPGD